MAKSKHLSHRKSNVTIVSYVNTETGAVVNEDFYNILSSDEQSKFQVVISPKLPTSEDLVEGELAVNYAADYETISLKNNVDEIVTFKSENYNDGKYASKEYIQDKLGGVIEESDVLEEIAEKSDKIVYSTLETVSQVTSIPVTSRVIEATISETPSQPVGLVNTNTLEPGSVMQVIVFNNGADSITLQIPHNPSVGSGKFRYWNMVMMHSGGDIIIPSGGVCEINFLFGSIDGEMQNVYIRYV